MTGPTVTLTGPPGSGKTTAGRLAAAALDRRFVSAGALFRAEAAARGSPLAEFSAAAERDPGIDRALDERMVALAGPDALLEGRITGALLRRRGVRVVYLVVTAPEPVRVDRLAARDGVAPEVARAQLRAREASERDRYRRYYGLDLDREAADLVVDSAAIPADEVARRLVAHVRAAGG
ncbi:MAG TPA: cytidylate kinase family protein [Thermoplasmata archaeon]|nr:cytidylate kinase family protein [Thermoplasmata archaeon]